MFQTNLREVSLFDFTCIIKIWKLFYVYMIFLQLLCDEILSEFEAADFDEFMVKHFFTWFSVTDNCIWILFFTSLYSTTKNSAQRKILFALQTNLFDNLSKMECAFYRKKMSFLIEGLSMYLEHVCIIRYEEVFFFKKKYIFWTLYLWCKEFYNTCTWVVIFLGVFLGIPPV